MRVFGLAGCNLGDVWASIQWALHTCLSWECRVSVWSPERYDKRDLLDQVKELITDGDRLSFVTEEPDTRARGTEPFMIPFRPVKSKFRWRYPGGPHVAVQFKGGSAADLKDVRDEEIDSFSRLFQYEEVVTLGLPMTLIESVEKLKTARVFVGIESGFAHVNGSVGCPSLLLRNRCNAEMLSLHSLRQGTWVANLAEASELLRQGGIG